MGPPDIERKTGGKGIIPASGEQKEEEIVGKEMAEEIKNADAEYEER